MGYDSGSGQVDPLVLQVYFQLLVLCNLVFYGFDLVVVFALAPRLLQAFDDGVEPTRRYRRLAFSKSHRVLQLCDCLLGVLVRLRMLTDLA